MSNVLIINAHQPSPFSEGKLNASFVEKATDLLQAKGHEIRTVTMVDDIDVDEQLDHLQWADKIILQSPINWMMVPWSFKKYLDDVFTAGSGGELCVSDGRSSDDPTKGYGTSGTRKHVQYMLSLTFNAPAEAFDNKEEFLFQGKSVDDLMYPMHANFRFLGMSALPSFSAFDVVKNPDIENDFKRFEAHLDQHF